MKSSNGSFGKMARRGDKVEKLFPEDRRGKKDQTMSILTHFSPGLYSSYT